MVVHPGLSKMQEAEADMAKDKGVPVVVLDCREVKDCATEAHLQAMPKWLDIIALIETPKAVRERTSPRTREELQLDLHAQLAEARASERVLVTQCMDRGEC